MSKKNTALQACIELLQGCLGATTDNAEADELDALIVQAKEALASNELDDYDISINGPDGIPLHPEPYPDLNAAVQAAAFFMLRFVPAGYYRDARMEKIPLQDLPKYLELDLQLREPEEEEEE